MVTRAKGPNFGVVSACATATHSIGEALRKIRAGEADVMIAGGTEAAITPLSFAGFSQLRAMSTAYNDNPTKSSR
jgi:3-oxoacyl-[acyl-carrier-protein] synthase II